MKQLKTEGNNIKLKVINNMETINAFETKVRDTGKEFCILNESHAHHADLKIWIQSCHDNGEILPNDYIYSVCKDVYNSFEQYAEESENDEERLRDLVTETIMSNWYVYYSEANVLLNEGGNVIDSLMDMVKQEGVFEWNEEEQFTSNMITLMRWIAYTFAVQFPMHVFIKEAE
jgi:hypothetical protein